MGKLPQPVWACVLAFMGLLLSLAVLYSHSADNIRLAVLAVASALVTGALGAFAGHAISQSNVTTKSLPGTITQDEPK